MTIRNYSHMAGPRPRRRILTAFAAVAVLLGSTGCSLLGGSDDETADPGGVVEKVKVKVGLIPSTDMAPLYVALKQGYFKEEGLDVELVPVGVGGDLVTNLISGDVDFTFANYPILINAQQKGKDKVNIKIVADASAAKPDTTAVVVQKDSPLRSAADLAGKKIAVPSIGSMADIAVLAGMKAARADSSGIDWKIMKFPDMLPKLQAGDIDAAFLVEPFLSIAQAQLGVWTVFQPMVGRMDSIALTGYAALEQTTTSYPKTVAAFQRAVLKAHRAAATPAGQNAIRQALMEEVRVKPEIASVLHLPAYPLTADPTRLQRVPDLLREFGLLDKPFDIRPMLVDS